MLAGLYLLSAMFDAGPTPVPIDQGYMSPYGQGGYDPAWYGDYGPTGQSATGGYDTTGVEVFNNPDATDWQDMVFIRE